MRWDEKKPEIHWINQDFMSHLIQKKIDKIKEREREAKLKSRLTSFRSSDKSTTGWIERLLQTPIEDNRKTCLWRILCPYIINIKKYLAKRPPYCWIG